MNTIVIDGMEYDFDALPDEAKKAITTLRFIDAEVARHQNLLAVQQTARAVYVNILKKELALHSK
jgi:hypothetical protein